MTFKAKKILLTIATAAIIIILSVILAVGVFIKLYVIPKYNDSLGADAPSEMRLTEKDVLHIAKNLISSNALENIKSFDTDSAEDLIKVAKELEEEVATVPEKKPEKSNWSEKVTTGTAELSKPTPAPKKTPTPTPAAPKSNTGTVNKSVPKKSEATGSTARERILNSATKEEISAGSAILAKVDLGKVNSLRSQGKTSELKKYITSVLTASEIRKALSLYNKYKHLL